MSSTEQFSTGAMRDSNTGKGRYDLIDPLFLRDLSRLLEYGAGHYGPENWRHGMPFSRTIDSMMRHLTNFRLGIEDPDHGMNLMAVAFGAMCMNYYLDQISRGQLPAELDDRHAMSRIPGSVCQTLGELRRHNAGAYDQVMCSNPDRKTPGLPHRIYVSGPYSHDDPMIRDWNWAVATYIGLVIMTSGGLAHVPHAATLPMDGFLRYARFMALDLSIIRWWPTHILVLGDSPGTQAEVERAKACKIPVIENLRGLGLIRAADTPTFLKFVNNCRPEFGSVTQRAPTWTSADIPSWVTKRIEVVCGELAP